MSATIWISPELQAVLDTAMARKKAAERKGKFTYEAAWLDDDDNVVASVRSKNLDTVIAAIGKEDSPDDATHISICTVHGNLGEELERYDICEDGHLRRVAS